MAQFKTVETAEGETLVLNRDYVVTFQPKYGDPKTGGYITLQNGVHRLSGFDVAKKEGGEILQWLLKD